MTGTRSTSELGRAVLYNRRDTLWQADAACRNVDPDLFWPEPRHLRNDAGRIRAAVDVCRRCPVLDECRLFADRVPRGMRAGGIWAGRVYRVSGERSTVFGVDVEAGR